MESHDLFPERIPEPKPKIDLLSRVLDKFLCLHKWTIHGSAKREVYSGFEETDILICLCCGKIKIIKY